MKKTNIIIGILLILIIILVTGCTKKAEDQDYSKTEQLVEVIEEEQLTYPEDYILREDEIPLGLSLVKFNKKDLREIGMSGNPGFVYSEDFFEGFDDPDSIEQAYAAFYGVPIENVDNPEYYDSQDFSLMMIAIQFSTEYDCEREALILKKETEDSRENNGFFFLKDKEFLIMVGSEEKYLAKTALKEINKRLNFEEI